MPSYEFMARDGRGRMQQGVRPSASPRTLVSELRGKGWVVFDVRPAGSLRGARLWRIRVGAALPVRSLDVEMALQQVAVMLRSGLTLLSALSSAADNADRERMRRVLHRMIVRVEEGSSFAEAMAEHREFGRLTVQLVRVGEQTGNLDMVMERAAESMERRRQLVQQVATALTYPFIVLVAAVGVSLFMVLDVIPKLEGFIRALGRKLPPMTVMLMDTSAWVRGSGPILLGMMVVLVVAGLMAWRSSARSGIDRILLRVPWVGRIMRVAGTALFARALAIQLRSGVTVLDGLRTLEGVGNNRHLAAIVRRTRDRVLSGGGLAEPLGEEGGFMPMLGRMVSVGESTGRLDDVLEEVARFFEGQLTVLIRQLSALVEPAIIVLVGGIVGFVYITFFLTLYSAAGTAK